MKLLALALATVAATEKSSQLQVGDPGVGDCTGCEAPVNTVIEPGNITLADCIKWLNQGCPNNIWPGNESQPRNCAKGSNAIGYDLGQGICRTFKCANPPGLDHTNGWKCYYLGPIPPQGPFITNGKANLFYHALPHTCLQKGYRMPWLDGYYTVNLAADACADYQPATEKGEHCAGFWFDRTKPTRCPYSTLTCYYFYFNTKFLPVKDTSGKCENGTASPSSSLRGHQHHSRSFSHNLDVPLDAIAIQKAFHIYPGSSVPMISPGSYTGNYSMAPLGLGCLHEDNCTSYTWKCSANSTSPGYSCGACPSNSADCQAKYPTSAHFQYSVAPDDSYLTSDPDSAVFFKIAKRTGEESMEIYQ